MEGHSSEEFSGGIMRFYVPPGFIFMDKGVIEVRDKKELHHIIDVMRLTRDTSVTIFDGLGMEYSGKIKDIRRDLVVVGIEKALQVNRDRSFHVTLYQAIAKKNKMDLIIEKAVELGVDAIMPIITERTIPDIRKNPDKKRDRWQRIAIAGSKQCGRTALPDVSAVKDLQAALSESKKSDIRVFAALDKDARPLKHVLRPGVKTIALFVGPEGDFSPEEIAIARETGCSISSLGPLVLRVETAAIYALSCINYEYMDR